MRFRSSPLRFLSVVCLLLLCAGQGGASAAPFATIDEIEILPESVAETYGQMIRANMALEAGQGLDPSLLSEDIKQLYKTDKFETVEARVLASGERTVRLVLEFRLRTVVRSIRTEGNSRIKTKRIRREIEHPEGAILDGQRLSADAANIRDLYRRKGFVATVVAVDRNEADDGAVDVVFRIDESGRKKVRTVTFEGNTAFSDGKLRKVVETRHRFWSFLFNTGFLHWRELERDRMRLAKHYADAGYLDLSIEKIDVEHSPGGTWSRIHFVLDEGQPYTVGEISVSGNTVFDSEELLDRVSLREGERLRAEVERQSAQAIAAPYHGRGYLDASALPRRTVRIEDHEVDIEFSVREGSPCTIREIHVEGNNITQDRVIRRELGVYPGDLADRRKIEAAERRLQNLGHFRFAEIVPLRTPDPAERDLRITVAETETGRLMLGGGYSTEAGLVGMFEVSQSNFDLMGWPTFRGAGQKLRLSAQFGTERDDFVLSFIEPWLFHRRLRLRTDLYIRDRNYGEYTEESAGVSMQITRAWLRHWRQSVGVRLEQIRLTDFSTNSVVLEDEEGEYGHHALTASVSRDTRDSFTDPRRGMRLDLGAELLSERWGSYADVYRLDAGISKYFPVLGDSAFKLDARLALADSISDRPVAIFDRYFAGGASTLRGFRYREVGPEDKRYPLGGKSRFLGTAEFRKPLVAKTIIGRVFCDFGNVWADTAGWDPEELNASIGFGVEFRMPIGPLVLDYGYPIERQQDHLDSGGRLHFTIGYTF